MNDKSTTFNLKAWISRQQHTGSESANHFYHIMTFNQYIGLTSATSYIRKNKNITEYPTEVADCLQVLHRVRRRTL